MSEALTPEQRARAVIDRQLAASGWLVCDRAGMDLVNHAGVAVREVMMSRLALSRAMSSSPVDLHPGSGLANAGSVRPARRRGERTTAARLRRLPDQCGREPIRHRS